MNKARKARIDAIASELADILSEEQDYFDNMPESIQAGDKGERAQEAVNALDEAVNALEGIES